MTQGLDIIGDIHGCATPLRRLLEKLGYTLDSASGAYHHADRRVVFVGDLIDRGPEQREVLELVKAMVDAGTADIVMGNHEFNAIAYATPDPDRPGEFLRQHSEKNTKQHRAFLEQLDDAERAHYIDWFMTLPLWLDNGQIRVIHACWHEPSMQVVREVCGGDRLTAKNIRDAATKGHALYRAVEVLLKGPEISLTKYGQPPYVDKDGSRRTEARIRWWDAGATTLRRLAEVRGMQTEDGDRYPETPALDVDPDDGPTFVYTGDVPLFYGHYWRKWENHKEDWTAHTACVDFSAVKGGPLVAYRWTGEPTISWQNYVPHDPALVAHHPSA